MKLEAGCLTMTETGGMGILSDHGWKKSRTTAKLLDEGGVYGWRRGGLADVGPGHHYEAYYHGLGGGMEAVFDRGGRGFVDPEKGAKKRAAR